MRYELFLGNCLGVLKGIPDNSVDSIVTDPPYGLSFMGKKWDYDVPDQAIWEECLRVLKPGGHLLAFSGTRTQHRMAVRIEDAGFEIRDMIAWVYGSGFPKSMDVSKAIDKAAGAEREVLGTIDPRSSFDGRERKSSAINTNWRGAEGRDDVRELSKKKITAPATDAAREWEGWGTALKPALEPITVARKQFKGTVAANVMAHGTGALNIDGCRVRMSDGEENPSIARYASTQQQGNNGWGHVNRGARFDDSAAASAALGRWPANLIHDGSDEVVGLFPQSNGAANGGRSERNSHNSEAYWGEGGGGFKVGRSTVAHADKGSAARFFYCAKTSRKDRNEGLSDPGPQFQHGTTLRKVENAATTGNNHPTVKPTDLMAYLCRLVTPPGGVVLDPFMGSGSTGKAAMREGFRFIGIEREPEYMEIAEKRIEHEAKKFPVDDFSDLI